MKRLGELAAVLDVDVSPPLRKHVVKLTSTYDGNSHRQRYEKMAKILDLYRTEKGWPKGAEPWQVLSILATTLVGTGWTTGRFTYYFHIGRSEIADAIWELADDEATCFMEGRCKRKCWLSSIQKAHEYAKTVHGHTDTPLLDAWHQTVTRLKLFGEKQERLWTKGLWDEPQWNEFRKLDGIPLKPPEGQRKTRQQAPRKPKKAKKGNSRKAAPTKPRRRRTPAKERELSAQLRTAFENWLNERTRLLPDEVRDLERGLAREEFERTIRYVQSQTLEGITDAQLLDRRAYVQACACLGVEPPRKGLVGVEAVRPVYRSLAKRLHPDHNPDLDPGMAVALRAEYQGVVEAYKFIQAYNQRNQNGQ